MKARISNLHKTEAEWNKLIGWKPEAGELIVFDPDDIYDYPRAKLGDGIHTLTELPFFIERTALKVLEGLDVDNSILDAGRITAYKK